MRARALGSSTVERPTVVVWLSAGRWFDSAPGDFPTPSLHSTPLHSPLTLSLPPSLPHSISPSLLPFVPSSLLPFSPSFLSPFPTPTRARTGPGRGKLPRRYSPGEPSKTTRCPGKSTTDLHLAQEINHSKSLSFDTTPPYPAGPWHVGAKVSFSRMRGEMPGDGRRCEEPGATSQGPARERSWGRFGTGGRPWPLAGWSDLILKRLL